MIALVLHLHLLLDCVGEKAEVKIDANEGKKMRDKLPVHGTAVSCLKSATLPCMDRLREELSCAVRSLLIVPTCRCRLLIGYEFFLSLIWVPTWQICLEICFEPSTTSCGHR